MHKLPTSVFIRPVITMHMRTCHENVQFAQLKQSLVCMIEEKNIGNRTSKRFQLHDQLGQCTYPNTLSANSKPFLASEILSAWIP